MDPLSKGQSMLPQRDMDPLSKGQSMLPQRDMDPLTNLEKDVQHLKECMETLHDTVLKQDTFDSIEDAIRSTQQRAIDSQQAIIVAKEYQTSYRNYVTAITTVTVTGILTALIILL